MTPNDQQSPNRPPLQPNVQSVGADNVREEDKIQLVLAYLGLFALIPLLTVKDSAFVQLHAKQGLVLNLSATLVMMIITPLGPLGLLNCLLGPALLVVDILAISKALKGERWQIPLVSDVASKF